VLEVAEPLGGHAEFCEQFGEVVVLQVVLVEGGVEVFVEGPETAVVEGAARACCSLAAAALEEGVALADAAVEGEDGLL
jgi:ribosomal protein L6P/L9E